MIFPNIVLVLFTLFTKIFQSHTQNMAKGVIIGIGIFFLIIAIIGYIFPFQDTTSPDPAATETIPQAVRVCNSEMGELAQSFSAEISKICSDYNVMIMGVYGSGILGIILIVVGAVVSRKI